MGSEFRPISYQYTNLICHLDPSQFIIRCFAEGTGSSLKDNDNIKIISFSNQSKTLKRLKIIRSALSRSDILHTGGGPIMRYYFSRLAKLRSPRLGHVHTLHLDIDPDSERYEYKRRLVKAADEVVGVSKHTAKTAEDAFGVRPIVVYNAVDTAYFTPDRDSPAMINTDLLQDPVFLFVGQLIERKRPMDVLEVAEQLPEATFLVRGNGPMLGTLRDQSQDLQNVHFIDKIPKKTLAQLYASVSGLIFPSVREGCPTVVLEAMAAGTPVVGYHATSMPELITNNETGYLADPLEIAGLIDGVLRLCDESTAQRLGTAARHYVVENHTFDRLADEYREVYQRVV